MSKCQSKRTAIQSNAQGEKEKEIILIFVVGLLVCLMAGLPHCSCNRKIEKKRKKKVNENFEKGDENIVKCQILTCNEFGNEKTVKLSQNKMISYFLYQLVALITQRLMNLV